jgi:hypothetical protein
LHSENGTLNPKGWLAWMLGITLAVAGAVAAINVSIDQYGLYHDDHGKHLIPYGDPRVSKYLLSERYVPENFNALLIGTSVSANWKTGAIKPLRVYNESLEGGVIVEDRAIAERAIAGGTIKVVLLLIQPYMTTDNNFRTVPLTHDVDATALGSKSLLDAYREEFSVKRSKEQPEFDEFGAQHFGDLPQQLNRKLQKMWAPTAKPFDIDASGMKDYTALVNELHAKNIQIVFVIPPIAEDLFEGRRTGFDEYSRLMLGLKGRQDEVMDFSTDQWRAFRADPGSFKDGIHLTDVGTATVVKTISDQLTEWIADGQLHVQPSAN